MEWNSYNAAFEALERMEKEAFIPMPGGQPPADPAAGGMPMDPAMAAGGGMPMDPAMMGGAPPMDPAMAGGMPMDPAMMGGAPPMDPAAAGAPPADPAADAAIYDMVTQIVRQVLQDMGVETEKGEKSESKSESGGGEGKGDRLSKLEKTVETIAAALGIPADGEEGGGPDAATGMSAGSGAPDPGMGAMPMMGPLDPMGGAGMADAAAMSGMPMPAPTEMPKQGGFRPLDDKTDIKNIATALRRLRSAQ